MDLVSMEVNCRDHDEPYGYEFSLASLAALQEVFTVHDEDDDEELLRGLARLEDEEEAQ